MQLFSIKIYYKNTTVVLAFSYGTVYGGMFQFLLPNSNICFRFLTVPNCRNMEASVRQAIASGVLKDTSTPIEVYMKAK